MASSPSYNPNLVENHFDRIEQITADCRPAGALLNRATAGLYAPGSTFKVVTTAAALETQRYDPTSEFVDPGYCTVYGKRVNNFDTSRPFGRISLATALQYSVNSVFCDDRQGARREGDPRRRRSGSASTSARRSRHPRASACRAASIADGELWKPARNREVDAGRMAFGQERMLVTPLQMAMVAGGVGNARDRDEAVRRREARLAARHDLGSDASPSASVARSGRSTPTISRR